MFYGYEEGGTLIGVMGLQDRGDVFLIRHAYVRTAFRRKGIGAMLLEHLEGLIQPLNQDDKDGTSGKDATGFRTGITRKPILMGTWKEAAWAVDFYEKNGYALVDTGEKNRLLRKYWSIPERQVETSVVLADRSWFASGTKKP